MTTITGTPIASVVSSAIGLDPCAVTLPRYAKRIGYNECAFFGVFTDSNGSNQCRAYWTKAQRDAVLFALKEAQHSIEEELRYFLSPRWVVGKLSDEPNENDRLVDQQNIRKTILTRWGRVIESGKEAVSIIQSGVSVSHATDPVVLTVATSVVNRDEIYVFHPDTDDQIQPLSVSISGGVATIKIPRCRMVKTALADNPETGLDYNDTDNFEAMVDIKRIYNDGSTNAVLVAPHVCSANCAQNDCGENTKTACMYIDNGRIGEVTLRPATYSSGSWTGSALNCHNYQYARLYYRAGVKVLTRTMEDAIIRLAHARMPQEPCGCNVHLWRRDRNIPEVLTRERLNCPFGLSDGAWMAWRFAQSARLMKAGVL